MTRLEPSVDHRLATTLSILGRLLLALPMVVFGIEHFLFAGFVAVIVPPWLPWHAFWTYLVGIALVAAGLAILFRKLSQLAAVLLGAMILAFFLLIHTRLLARLPGDAYAASPLFGALPGRIINMWKDLGLSGAAFTFAGTQTGIWKHSATEKLFMLGRWLIALSVLAFGVLHFVYPGLAPGVEPITPSITFFLPGQPLWSYLTGVAFLLAGACIFLNKKVRLAATFTGIVVLFFALLVWVPWLHQHPRDIAGANYLKDIGLAGGALILAGAVPRRDD